MAAFQARRHAHHREPRLRGRRSRAQQRTTGSTTSFDQEIRETEEWFESPRFEGITRLYTARQVVEQRGTIPQDYTVARARLPRAFHARSASCSTEKKSITTFGPYSPGQAVAMKRLGIEGSTSAAGPPRPRAP